MEYLIRPMQTADLAPCAVIEESAGDPWSLQQLAEELTNQQSGGAARLFVATCNDKVVGLAAWQLAAGEASLYTLTVCPSVRRTGAGYALLQQSMTLLRQEGAVCAFLEVRASNLAAISLYQKAGFEKAGLRKNFYQAPTEDAVVMNVEWNN